MGYRLFLSLLKVLFASLLVGIALSAFNITPDRVLQDFGMTPQQVMDYSRRAIRWAVPHVILGALITVPIWLIMFLLRPPRGD